MMMKACQTLLNENMQQKGKKKEHEERIQVLEGKQNPKTRTDHQEEREQTTF
jgi:hypothetical protein